MVEKKGVRFDFDFDEIDEIIDRIQDKPKQADRAKERNRVDASDKAIRDELTRQGFIVGEN